MTALAVPPEAADVPVSPRSARSVPQPLAVVFADLLPDEVRAKRRLRYVKRRLVFALVALVLLIGLGDALARQQTSSAEGNLSSTNAQIATYNGQLGKFTPVLTTQGEIQQIRTQLSGALVNDVSWTALLNTLRTKAPKGLQTASVDAQLDDPSSTAALPAATTGLTTTSESVVGSLTLSGSAPNYSSVAAYVVALSRVKGFTAVNPATVANAETGHRLAFTVTLSLTSGILSGHYTPVPATTAGSATAPPAIASTTPATKSAPPKASGSSKHPTHKAATTPPAPPVGD